jgi:hypothetical protein
MMAPTPLQCDSPNVVTRNSFPKVLIKVKGIDERLSKRQPSIALSGLNSHFFDFQKMSHDLMRLFAEPRGSPLNCLWQTTFKQLF